MLFRSFVFAIWAIKGTGEKSVTWGFLALLVGVPLYIWQTRQKTVG